MNSRVVSNISLAAGMLIATACSSETATTAFGNPPGGAAGAAVGAPTGGLPNAVGGNNQTSAGGSSQNSVGGNGQTNAGGNSSSNTNNGTSTGGTSSSSSSNSSVGGNTSSTKAAGGNTNQTGGTSSSSQVGGNTQAGGTSAVGGTSSSSQAGGNTSTTSTGGGGSDDPLGGYHVQGDWAGFAFTFADGGATITPDADTGYKTMTDKDGPYCAKGTVAATTDYTSIAAVGINTKQDKIPDAPTGKIATSSTGMVVNISNPGKSESLRVQIEDGTDPKAADAAQHRWCVNISDFDKDVVIPWESFNTECWSGGDGTAFDPSTPLAKVIIYLPDTGPDGASQNFDFCVNKIGPADVKSRGTGSIVSSCSNSVTWSSSTITGQYDNVATGDGKYRFQANGWNMSGGSHSFSLLSACGFKVSNQSCDQSNGDGKPCSFPSIYVGTNSGNPTNRTSGFTPKQISAISSVPTCYGWSAASNAGDQYNASYDVWLNDNSSATNAGVYLMVWFHKPSNFQPGGDPKADGVVIAGQLWTVWWGDNGQGTNVVSYLSPNDLAKGQAFSFDLKDFIDDAVDRGYLRTSQYLIAVMGGLEIWGGAQGASVTSFKAEVQ